MKEEILKRLEEFIALMGWNKREFAAKVGIFPQEVNRYLSGENTITRLFIPLYFNGCNLHWLIDNEEVYKNTINRDSIDKINNKFSDEVNSTLILENERLKIRLEEKELFIDKLLSRDYDSKEANKVVATVKNY